MHPGEIRQGALRHLGQRVPDVQIVACTAWNRDRTERSEEREIRPDQEQEERDKTEDDVRTERHKNEACLRQVVGTHDEEHALAEVLVQIDVAGEADRVEEFVRDKHQDRRASAEDVVRTEAAAQEEKRQCDGEQADRGDVHPEGQLFHIAGFFERYGAFGMFAVGESGFIAAVAAFVLEGFHLSVPGCFVEVGPLRGN